MNRNGLRRTLTGVAVLLGAWLPVAAGSITIPPGNQVTGINFTSGWATYSGGAVGTLGVPESLVATAEVSSLQLSSSPPLTLGTGQVSLVVQVDLQGTIMGNASNALGSYSKPAADFALIDHTDGDALLFAGDFDTTALLSITSIAGTTQGSLAGAYSLSPGFVPTAFSTALIDTSGQLVLSLFGMPSLAGLLDGAGGLESFNLGTLGSPGSVGAQMFPSPEPGTLLLLGSGLTGLALAGRRKRS